MSVSVSVSVSVFVFVCVSVCIQDVNKPVEIQLICYRNLYSMCTCVCAGFGE